MGVLALAEGVAYGVGVDVKCVTVIFFFSIVIMELSNFRLFPYNDVYSLRTYTFLLFDLFMLLFPCVFLKKGGGEVVCSDLSFFLIQISPAECFM